MSFLAILQDNRNFEDVVEMVKSEPAGNVSTTKNRQTKSAVARKKLRDSKSGRFKKKTAE